MKKLLFLLTLAVLAAPVANAQQSKCVDAADEPHHQLVYQDSTVRIFMVELGRLESTEQYCNRHAFFRVAMNDGRVSNLIQGGTPVSRAWHAGEALFVPGPEDHVLRNESGDTFREMEIETSRKDPQHSNTVICPEVIPAMGSPYSYCHAEPDPESFPPGISDSETWTVNLDRGGIHLIKRHLMPNASAKVDGSEVLMLALTDSTLKIEADGRTKNANLDGSQILLLPGDVERKVTNTGRFAAEFITVEE